MKRKPPHERHVKWPKRKVSARSAVTNNDQAKIAILDQCCQSVECLVRGEVLDLSIDIDKAKIAILDKCSQRIDCLVRGKVIDLDAK